MIGLESDLRRILTVTLKARHDDLTDQLNRLIMVKLFLVCCLIMGISWFTDSINCIVPAINTVETAFVSQACWIQGFYVFKPLMTRFDVAFFGIPRDIDSNGLLASGELCTVQPSFGIASDKCIPMEKIFYLQYQWMPFLIGSLSAVYYIPYVFFLQANSDMISLKAAVMGKEKPSKIVSMFFGCKSQRFLKLRVVSSIFVKSLYLIVNIGTFVFLNFLLNGEYYKYGVRWANWSKQSNTDAFDYMGKKTNPRPGSQLLPPFGYCELFESSKDIKYTVANRHKFVCELSQHVLYQYCLLVLWFFIIGGIIISSLGIFFHVYQYVHLICARYSYKGHKNMFLKTLTLRELLYLDLIKTKNNKLYEEVIENLELQSSVKMRNGRNHHTSVTEIDLLTK
ncbi:innexin shaking-B isoform X1 [Hydra vulgaris]|uniref:innexin shaking-B isoform X1 n=2 Tax=Hydra vulgaris TaxID=6087 RepID=UPI0006411EAB|nr:innexin shaking-B isoform X1 [Hydra vulgaris]